MKNLLILIFTIVFSSICFAQNPIITQRFTADPAGLEYNGRLYIWSSHDIDGQQGYGMNDITCVSTTDMVNWTDHGEVYHAKDINWTDTTMAPSVVYINGKFVMFVNGLGSNNIGVAISDSPTGPFKDALGEPIISRKKTPNADVRWCFDPTVLVDDNGDAYCVFGGGPDGKKNARIIKLAPDLMSTVGDAITIDAPHFFEGGWIHTRTFNGVKKYYYSYFSWNGTPATIDYMMSDNPLSGWEYKGTILPALPDNAGNSHAGVFPYKDKWYIAYHNRKVHFNRVDAGLEIKNMKQRSVCIDELQYNDDYTIKQVVPSEGPKQSESLNPFVKNEAETMAAQSYMLPGIETDSCSDENGGRMVTAIDNGDWIKVAGVDFKEGATSFEARIASPKKGATIEIRLDSENGKLIGTCFVIAAENFETWNTISSNIKEVKGKHDVFFKFKGEGGNLFNFNWWQFNK